MANMNVRGLAAFVAEEANRNPSTRNTVGTVGKYHAPIGYSMR